jgi:SAM-dependent methyltransferase
VTAPAAAAQGRCRSCTGPLGPVLLDLGLQPIAELDDLGGESDRVERRPLRLHCCDRCGLVQLGREGPEPPSDAHGHGGPFSSTVTAHVSARVTDLIRIAGVGPGRLVVDVAAAEGNVLAACRQAGAEVIGFDTDPARVHRAALGGLDVRALAGPADLPAALAGLGRRAHLVVVDHALAHVDNFDGLIGGLAAIVHPDGIIAIEAHHVLGLLEDGAFDIVSHPHRTYLGLGALEHALARHGLVALDAARSALHGGSFSVIVRPVDGKRVGGPSVISLRALEAAARVAEPAAYRPVAEQAGSVRTELRRFLETAITRGEAVAAYGASSRGLTLLGFAGITSREIAFVADRDPAKVGRFLAGTGIPVRSPEAITSEQPAWILILPWPIAPEIALQLAPVRVWGGRFAVALPSVHEID